MAVTNLVDVSTEIGKVWTPIMETSLYEKTILANILRADQSQLNVANFREGDTVHVSEYNEGTGELLTIDGAGGGCAFTPEKIGVTGTDIKIDKRAVYSVEFCDLVELQSKVTLENDKLRNVAARAVERQINNHLYSKVAPIAGNILVKPTLSATALTELTTIADDNFWPDEDRWLVVDAKYWQDLLNDTTIVSANTTGVDSPIVANGQVVLRRYGWNIVKDISAPLKAVVGGGTPGVAVAMLPDFLPLVIQQGFRTKISDGHANNNFKIVFSIDAVFGASLGVNGAKKHMKITSV